MRKINTIACSELNRVIGIGNQRAHLCCSRWAIRDAILGKRWISINAPGQLPWPRCRRTRLLRRNAVEEHVDMQVLLFREIVHYVIHRIEIALDLDISNRNIRPSGVAVAFGVTVSVGGSVTAGVSVATGTSICSCVGTLVFVASDSVCVGSLIGG